MKKYKNKLFLLLLNVVYSLVIIVFIYVFLIIIHDWIDPENTVKNLYFNRYKVASGSMVPTLEKDDIVIVMKVDPQSLTSSEYRHDTKSDKKFDENKEKGDIVVFMPRKPINKEWIIHRVVENDKAKKQITTLGDRNHSMIENDKEIGYDKIIGKYLFRIRARWVKMIIVLITVFSIFFCIYCLYYFIYQNITIK